jgi:hypothetical protein
MSTAASREVRVVINGRLIARNLGADRDPRQAS